MQTALRQKHEQFLILIVNEGFSPVDAYKAAYPKATEHSARSATKRLMANVAIQDRRRELERVKTAASLVSVAFLTKEMLEEARLARKAGQHAAAQTCLMGVAKMHGFLVDKQQTELLIRRPAASPDSPDDMSESLWLEQYGALMIEGSLTDAQGVDQGDQGDDQERAQVRPGE